MVFWQNADRLSLLVEFARYSSIFFSHYKLINQRILLFVMGTRAIAVVPSLVRCLMYFLYQLAVFFSLNESANSIFYFVARFKFCSNPV